MPVDDDERNDATTEMTIIRADKIAFDEHSVASTHSNLSRGDTPAGRSASSSLLHCLTPRHSPGKSIRPETQPDRKLDSGDQRREEGRAGRPNLTGVAHCSNRESGVCSVERQQIDAATCAPMANVSVALGGDH